MAAGGNKGSEKSTGGETGAEHFGGSDVMIVPPVERLHEGAVFLGQLLGYDN